MTKLYQQPIETMSCYQLEVINKGTRKLTVMVGLRLMLGALACSKEQS